MSGYTPNGRPSPQLFSMMSNNPTDGVQVYYYFDAVISVHHIKDLVITHHPVQDGANISDHAYVLPARLSFEIAMSDVVERYVTEDSEDYDSDVSKSVSAYEAFLELQSERTPLEVTTRIHTYKNMLIVSLNPVEDSKTTASLICRVSLEEIIVANASTQVVSSKPMGPTNKGDVSSVPYTPPSSADDPVGLFQPPSN